jgi:hypothetical protein
VKPRALFRTHYQVDEPALIEFLALRCTSPVQSAYREVVAERLAAAIRARGKPFNVAAGSYAVDLARGLEVLTDQHVWSDRGHVVGLLAEVGEGDWEQDLVLTLPEKLLHFWLFLEADGAALLFLARRLVDRGRLGDLESGWNAITREMFLSIFSDYLMITSTTADRVKLRTEIDRLKAKAYEGKSGAHKAFVHLQTLHRLGLVNRSSAAATRIYEWNEDRNATTGLAALLSAVPDVLTLEDVIKNRSWARVAAQVFGVLNDQSTTGKLNEDRVASLLANYYQRVSETSVPLVPLSTLMTSIQIRLLSDDSPILASHDDLLAIMESLRKDAPKDIRFHVDRRGQPAFVKLSDSMCRALAGRDPGSSV